ncbi:MAG: DsbE family thiol:disulfide interchange protein, partial [Candidatus Puniceispirillum sp.]
NYFASWCAPCRAEAPALGLLSQRIDIVGIAYKDRLEDTNKFLAEYGNPFHAIMVDKDGMAAISWGVYGVPETFILDENGTVLFRHAGPITRAVLEQDIEKILAGLKL